MRARAPREMAPKRAQKEASKEAAERAQKADEAEEEDTDQECEGDDENLNGGPPACHEADVIAQVDSG